MYNYLCPDLGNQPFLHYYFIAPYYRCTYPLSKHSHRITRDGQVCFSTQLFLDCAKHWEASADGVRSLEGFNRMAWMHNISQMLWCGLWLLWWLVLHILGDMGVSYLLYIYFNHHPSIPPQPPIHTHINVTLNYAAMSLKASLKPSGANHQWWV